MTSSNLSLEPLLSTPHASTSIPGELLHAVPAEVDGTLRTDHRWTPTILLDPLGAVRATLCRLLDLLQRLHLLVHAILGAQLILLAALSFMVRPITGDASLGSTLVAYADVRLSRDLDLFHRLLGCLSLLRLRLFGNSFDFGLVDLSGSTARRETPTPSRSCVADMLALELVEHGVNLLRGRFLDVHVPHDGTTVWMRTLDTPVAQRKR